MIVRVTGSGWGLSRAAEELLSLCAVLAPGAPIPLDLFAAHPRSAAVDELVGRGLARFDLSAITITVTATVGDADVAAARDLLYQHLPTDVTSPASWPVWRALLPHVLAALAHPTHDLSADEHVVWLLNAAALFLRAQGDPAASVPLLERAHRLSQLQCGPDDPQTLTTRSNLAKACLSAGEAERAVTLLESVVADRARVLGADHPATVKSRGDLAEARRAAPAGPVPGTGSGHVFISYSHDAADTAYVEQLAASVSRAGVPVWFDHGLAGGDRWETVLRERVDSCAALIVVMSPTAAASRWVDLEVGRAQWRGRPVLPILLSGAPFPQLEHLHYVPSQLSPRFVDDLRALTAAPRPSPSPRPGTVVGRWPGHNPHFVGRGDLLVDLEARLYRGSSVTLQALQGTGGVGKTQLAAEYVHRRRADYDLIAWVDADRVELIPPQVSELAPALGVASTQDVVETARAVITALDTTALSWLLVYDNANEPGELTEWVPRGGRGQVLVTSRRTGWDGAALDVDVLTSAEAITLLRHRLPDIDDTLASGIVEQLGRLPLAIEQAGAYLVETGTPPADYQDLLRTQGAALLAQGQAPGHQHTVATVWQISQASLRINSPAAEQLLILGSFLGPEPIPLDLFSTHPDLMPAPLSTVAGEPAVFNAVVGALVARSLARRGAEGITIHRLLATVIRDAQPTARSSEMIAITRELLFRRLPRELGSAPESWPLLRAFLPHVLAATSHDAVHLGETDPTAWLLGLVGSFLLSQGQVASAITLMERAAAINQDALGPEDPHTLSSRANLAVAYSDAGQFAAAIAVAEAALAVAERVLGSDDPVTLGCRNILGVAYQEAGQVDRALPLLESALADGARALGGDGVGTLSYRTNLATTYVRAGQVDQATLMLESAVADLRRTLGPDHPDTLTARNNLASAYQRAGQLDRAISLFEALVTDCERALGPDGPITLGARNNLATACFEAGQVDRAIELYRALLPDLERVLGPDHPFTVGCRGNLATVSDQAEQADQAEQTSQAMVVDENVLAEHERRLGPDHPETLAARAHLAWAWVEVGQPDRAIPLLERNLAYHRQLFGPGHAETMNAGYLLALAYRDAGLRDRALPLLEAVLAVQEEVLGSDHPDTLASRQTLADLHLWAGQPDRAIALYAAVVAAREEALGPDHLDTVAAQASLALAYQSAGQPEPAIPLLLKVLAVQERLLGPAHPETLRNRLGLGVAFCAVGGDNLPIGVRMLAVLLADCERMLGPDHSLTEQVRQLVARFR